jgi:hypothetical protein
VKIFAAAIPADGGGTDYVIFNAEGEQHAHEILAQDYDCEMPEACEELTPRWLDDYYDGQAVLSTERS